MRPDNETLIKKCELETQKLFELFLDVNEVKLKFQSQETNEVQYQVRERDSRVRSGSYGSSNSLTGSTSNISLRGLDDVSKYKDAIEKKRKSIDRAPPMFGSYPTLSTLESDSARAPAAVLSISPPSVINHQSGVKRRPVSAEIKRQRPSSGSPAYERFPTESRSRSNTGPSEELLSEAARTIAEIGDNIEEEYQDRMTKVKSQLVAFLSENTTPSYEVFAAHVNELVGEDRNWTNLVFVMQLGKRILLTGHAAGQQTRSYFTRFLGTAFGEEVARYGNADQYVRDHAAARSINNE